MKLKWIVVGLALLLGASVGAMPLPAQQSGNPFVESAPQHGTRIVSRMVLTDYVREAIVIEPADKPAIPAILCIPRQGKGPFPVVMLIHGAVGDSKERISETYAGPLARSGVASVAYDLPGHGQRSNDKSDFAVSLALLIMQINNAPGGAPKLADLRNPASGESLIPNLVQGMAQSVQDGQQVLNYMAERPELDSKHVAVDGVSLGGTIAVVLTSLDHRISAALLNVAGGWPALAASAGEDARTKAAWAQIDPKVHAAAIAPRPVLMINGKKDPLVHQDNARALFNYLGQPKQIRWYNMGHEISPKAAQEGTQWLIQTLRSARPTTRPAAS